MYKKHVIAAIMLICMFIMASCGKEVDDIIMIDDTSKIVIEDEVGKNEENNNEENNNEEEIVENEDNTNKEKSSLDGLMYEKELLTNRPIVFSIDNHPKARPQAGLSEAEIVYEVEVEAPYTRYLAVFQSLEPKLIGPVRSARPYLIYLSLEYDSIFAHVGGSAEAFQKLYDLSVADIDGLYTSAMWRYYDTNKYAPHNLYTSSKKLREDASNKNYKTEFEFDGYKFNDSDLDLNNNVGAKNVEIVYNNSNSTNYVYDEEAKVYIRLKDDEKHFDENNNKQITAKNILIYSVDKKVLDNEGRLYLGVIGKGFGYYITNGKVIEIKWQKDSETDRTKFYYDNQEIKLNPGNTWVQVVNKRTEVNITE
ncbi:DUF3048 domain-containing protein [Sedimentibacter sp. zth1]|uniref:DUF3048 domain-containing protein n=1 Tax=Sedimentibacter sp. zth1 TaxID=2816908 RepID=UPI001A9246F1|nr:DUF3048 domain-containing protein [Sedimentibacter sp. zth1]QSX06838.1 DUF3048 domain-containing protein [Sedimentibacter sp. zth1]